MYINMNMLNIVPVTLCLSLIVSGALASEKYTADAVASKIRELPITYINEHEARIDIAKVEFLHTLHTTPGARHSGYMILPGLLCATKVKPLSPPTGITIKAIAIDEKGFTRIKYFAFYNIVDNEGNFDKNKFHDALNYFSRPEGFANKTMQTQITTTPVQDYKQAITSSGRYMHITPVAPSAGKGTTQFMARLKNPEESKT